MCWKAIEYPSMCAISTLIEFLIGWTLFSKRQTLMKKN